MSVCVCVCLCVRAEQKELKAKLEELKYSGQGTLGNRRVVDDFEQHLAVATASCERNRVKSERLTKILVNVKAGIQHLYEKLEVVDIGEMKLSTDAKDEVRRLCSYPLFVPNATHARAACVARDFVVWWH